MGVENGNGIRLGEQISPLERVAADLIADAQKLEALFDDFINQFPEAADKLDELRNGLRQRISTERSYDSV